MKLNELLIGIIEDAEREIPFSDLRVKRNLDYAKFILERVELEQDMDDNDVKSLRKSYIETNRGLGL